MPSFFVSIPGTRDILGLIKSCNEGISSDFKVPSLKVGTLDELISAGDELLKQDKIVEQIAVKIMDTLQSLTSIILTVNNRPVLDYIKDFEWNSLRYRHDKPMNSILEMIMTEVIGIDNTLKLKLQQYNASKTQLQQIERKQSGTLLTKSLADIVKKEDFILGSEYLETLIVVVANRLEQEWIQEYELISEMVVPRSSKKIAHDADYALFTVAVFKKFKSQFAEKCKSKYAIREFQVDGQEDLKKEYDQLTLVVKEQWSGLVRLLKSNFSDVYSAWMHIKAMRVFVESVLRYGVPPEFVSCTMYCKEDKKVRKNLTELYRKLTNSRDSDFTKGLSNEQKQLIEQHMASLNLEDSYEPKYGDDLEISVRQAKPMLLLTLFILTFAATEIRIVNPTTTSKWIAGQDVFIVWEIVTTGNSKLTFNLMDASQGNNDAPLVKTISSGVDSNKLKLSYTVPNDLQDGKYFIQTVPEDGKPQYSSSFQIQKASSSSGTTSNSPSDSGNTQQNSGSSITVSGVVILTVFVVQ